MPPIVLLGVDRQQAHRMEGVCAIRIRRESLLTTELRIKKSFGSQMIEAGLAKRAEAGDIA
jgi:hypothetical protein